jgi:primase-polymerase (primpol)-like protein
MTILCNANSTYTEISPSGDGLHIWGIGHLKRGRRTSWHGQPIEAYATGRYMTVTGNRFLEAPSRLANIQPLLDFISDL